MRSLEPLHVLQVTPYYRDAWGYGGIPRVVTSLCRGLVRRGHRVTVCTTDAGDREARAGDGSRSLWVTDVDGVEVCSFPNFSNYLAYQQQFFLPLGMRRFFRQHAHRFDVAHLHGCHHLPGSIAAAELARHAVPYVLAPNGTGPRIERRRVAKWFFDATFGRGVMPAAARLIAVTRAEQRQLERLGVRSERIRVVPNPVDIEAFSHVRRRGSFRNGLGKKFERYVLYLGKITPRKRVDLLIQAFARLDHDRLGLVVAGNDMGGEPRMRRLVRRLRLEDRVHFTGQLKGAERAAALGDAAVLVYPGRDEIFGLAPLEALLCGTPVVVADDSGCGEVIRRVGGGRVVPQGDVAALANAVLATLRKHRNGSPAIRYAQRRIRSLFSSEAVSLAFERIYAELVERPGVNVVAGDAA